MANLDLQVVLAKSTSLNPEQIQSLLKNPSLSGYSTIGESLSDKDFANADELLSELCREMGLDYIKDIPVNDIPADLIRDLPINYAKQQGILPFREEQDQVIALTSNPINVTHHRSFGSRRR